MHLRIFSDSSKFCKSVWRYRCLLLCTYEQLRAEFEYLLVVLSTHDTQLSSTLSRRPPSSRRVYRLLASVGFIDSKFAPFLPIVSSFPRLLSFHSSRKILLKLSQNSPGLCNYPLYTLIHLLEHFSHPLRPFSDLSDSHLHPNSSRPLSLSFALCSATSSPIRRPRSAK